MQQSHTNGPNLLEIHVYADTVVRDCELSKALYTDALAKKIRVFQYDRNRQLVQTGAVLGQIYFASDPVSKDILSDNYNMEAFFVNADHSTRSLPIACRHLAYYWALKRQQENASKKIGAHFVERLREDLGDLEKIQSNIPLAVEDRYRDILHRSSENYFVGRSQWGKFIQAQFVKMKVPATRHLSVDSGVHAMLVELKTKKIANDNVQYVVLFYDPNWTLTYRRCVENDLAKVASWSQESLMSEEDIYFCFGEEKISRWAVLPDQLHKRTITTPIFPDTVPIKRSLELFATAEEAMDPSLAWHLFANGLSLAMLERQLSKCRTVEEKKALMVAKNTQGIPGLYMVFQDNYAHTLRNFVVIMKMAMEQGWLSSTELNEILAAKNLTEVPGLYMALQEGHADIVLVFGELLKIALQEQYLDIKQVTHLLMAEKANGTQGIHMALHNRHMKAVLAFNKISKVTSGIRQSY